MLFSIEKVLVQNTFIDGTLYDVQVSLIMVVFFLIVVFVIAHCRNLHNIAPRRATAAETLISPLAVVQRGNPED